MNFSLALEDEMNNFVSDISSVSLEDITDTVLQNAFRGVKIACNDIGILNKLKACMEAYDTATLDKYSSSMYNIITERIRNDYGIEVISIENIENKSQLQIAQEGITDIIKKIWDAIKNVISKIYNAIKKFFIGEETQEAKLNKDLEKSLDKANDIKKKLKNRKYAKVNKKFNEYSNKKLKINPKHQVTEIIKSDSSNTQTEEIINIDYSNIEINPSDLERFRHLNAHLDASFINSYLTRLNNYNHLIVMTNRVLNANVDNLDGTIEIFGNQKRTMSFEENIKYLYSDTCNRLVTLNYELSQASVEVPTVAEDLRFVPEPRRRSTISTMPYLDSGDMIYIYAQEDPEERKKPYYLMFLYGNTLTTTATDKVTAPLIDNDDLIIILNKMVSLSTLLEKNTSEMLKTNKLCDVLKDRIEKVKLYDHEGCNNPETLEIMNKCLSNISTFYNIFFYYLQNITKLNKKIRICLDEIQVLIQMNIYHYNEIENYIVEE